MEKFDEIYVLYFDPDNITLENLQKYFDRISEELPIQKPILCLPDALKLDRVDESVLEQYIKIIQKVLADINTKKSVDSSENIWYSSGNAAMK